MKKSTIIIILIVYLASIIVVGFFGMRVKVYDKVKYVQSIEVTAQAENKNMILWEANGLDDNLNHKYTLKILFTEHALIDQDGNKYLPVIFMPQVTYDSGDIAGETEKIKYEINSEFDLEGSGQIVLSQRGELTCKAKTPAFEVIIRPVGTGLQGSQAIISVYVF